MSAVEILPGEEWRPSLEFPDIIHVSNLGRVKVLERKTEVNTKQGKHYTLSYPEHLLKGYVRDDGYLEVHIYYDGHDHVKYRAIHRLVAEAFIPNPENKPTVNHIDTVKSNNNVTNLEWATNQEQSDHAKAHGLLSREGKQLEKAIQHAKSNLTKINSGQWSNDWRKVKDLDTGIEYTSITKATEMTGYKCIGLSCKENRRIVGRDGRSYHFQFL